MKNKKSFKLFDSKVFWAVVSLIMSLLIWVYITGTQETTIKKTFNNVEVVFSGENELRDSRGYVITDVETNTVSVEISGTRANIGSLSESDITAVIDVSKITTTGNNTVPYTLTYPDGVDRDGITELSTSPSTIHFYVDKESSKQVPVQGVFTGSAADGYVVGDIKFSPETITVTGPANEVDTIDHVWVEMGGDSLTKEKTAELSFTLTDADGNALTYDDLQFDRDTVTVTVPITKKKDVLLDVTIVSGAGATRDANCKITIEPATVTIAGDAETVDGINSIILDTIDLTDFADSYEATVPIKLPNDVQNVSGVTEATVKIQIIGLETKTFSVTNLSFINLPDSFSSASIVSKSIVVTVRAGADVLNSISATDIRAVADLTGVTSTGDVYVGVKIYINGNVDAGAIGNYEVIVNIQS